jgi:uncharacterized RDD family membrane protein YckC
MDESQSKQPQENAAPSDEGQSLWQLLNAPGSMAGADDPLNDLSVQPRPAPAETSWERSAEEVREAEAAAAREAAAKAVKPAQQQDEHWSQIRKILETPDDVSDDFDLSSQSRVSTETEDGDPSVLAFMRDDALLIRCRKHPAIDAKAQCPECQAYYCQDCLVIRKGKLLCRDCADTVFVPTEEQVLEAAERGGETAEEQVMPTAAPEFQVGTEMFGREGEPSNPVKQLIALLIDLALCRGTVFLVLWLLSVVGDPKGPLFAIFGAEGLQIGFGGWLKTFILGMPPMPWLFLFFMTDFVYYFLTLGFSNRTPGMSSTGCRIATVWGDFVPFGAVALRTLIFLVQLSFPALIIAAFIPGFRGLHDIMAGTVVVNYAGVKRVDAYETIQIKL